MKTDKEISNAASILASKSRLKPSPAQKAASVENGKSGGKHGKKGGRPLIWHKPMSRGIKNPLAETARYTVIRLADSFERFVSVKPAPSKSFMVWDNRKGREA